MIRPKVRAMAITPRDEDEEGWLSVLLALRLRQIEAEVGGIKALAEATGLSRGTLYQLRTAKANPTLVTVERMARHLNMSVWELLSRSGDEKQVRGDLEKNGLSYDEIAHHIEMTRAAKRSLVNLYGEDALLGSKASKRALAELDEEEDQGEDFSATKPNESRTAKRASVPKRR